MTLYDNDAMAGHDHNDASAADAGCKVQERWHEDFYHDTVSVAAGRLCFL
jgi:hypothetical protein